VLIGTSPRSAPAGRRPQDAQAAGNIAALLAIADVDGALVGGASLNVQDFLQIVTGAVRPDRAS
jgi:hypothetical protein